MKKIILLSLLMTQLLTANVFADTTLKTSDVFVTATRTPISKNNVIADVTTITEEEIERAGSSSLTDLLQRQPGIEIYNSGGQGKVSSLHIRGSESDHVVVLIDGLRVNQVTSGLTAFENIPLSQIEKIEIVRGASSSLYGAGAIGGVIQIFTKKGVSGFKPYAAIGYGRYDTKTAQAGIRAGNDSTNYAINISSLSTDGFSALKTNDPIFNDKDGYNNLSLSGSINHKFNQDNSIGINFIKSSGNNKYDNRFATSFIDYKNKMDTQATGINFSNKVTNDWQSDLKIGQSIYKYNGHDGVSWTPNISKQNQLSWLNNITLSLGSLLLGYDFNRETINKSLEYDKSERNNSGYLVGYLLNRDNHNLQLNYRVDDNSAYGKFNTGNIGYGYNLNKQWNISSIYGTAFRAPNFMDLYFCSSYGCSNNPNLKPEESKNIEASLRYQKDEDKFSATIFKNKIDNFIQLDSGYIPQNTEKAKFEGITFNGSTFVDHFQLYGNVTLQSAKNDVTNQKLLRRSQQYGNLGLNYYSGPWNMGTEINASGSKNDACDPFEFSCPIKIPGYAVVNLVADYKINNDMKLNLRINNLLNKDYALAYDGQPGATGDYGARGFAYQTAGASFFINLRYEPQ
ncbi:TonB-dependent receptor domain-containing protein [Candidatus Methylopumilus planktonicus]|uniref:TonB-dependent receptor domain-containing protein n=1 Tax=Candidatus Methylopumilus planktonicus TaxID=1581557 RepID=UPI0011247D24|nr:TonB-dependent receptor [Candidatus Methylopumilus planktonicus]QDD10333.1 TonB-dependent receptor [Candidatus Methylopumilus planktonicus]QDD22803.1 TonB-dependent receptor [Candidatus Methylopumilus planktonicus]